MSTAAEFNASEVAANRLTPAMVSYLTRGIIDLQLAVREFQKRSGLVVDGYAGAKTQAALLAAMGAAQPAPLVTGPVVERMPLFVPDWAGWEPADPDGDGIDKNWRNRPCPGFSAHAVGDRAKIVTLGGGFDAPRGDGLHRAEDWMCPSGVIVRTPADVEIVAWKNGAVWVPGVADTPKGGHCMRLRDARRWEHYVGHMLRPPARLELYETAGQTRIVETTLLKTGDVLPKGAMVGFVGRTGNAARSDARGHKTGCPHLHHSLTAPNVAAARAYGLAHGVAYAGAKVDVTAVFRALFNAGDHLRR